MHRRETSYSDDRTQSWRYLGKAFAGDRGHFLLSGALQQRSDYLWGIAVDQVRPLRDDQSELPQQMVSRFKLTVPNCGENSAPGGVINTAH